MLSTIKNNRSLTFYQQQHTTTNSMITASHGGGIASALIADTSFYTGTATSGYKTQLQTFLTNLNAKRAADIINLDLTKANITARNRGVQRAWEYERADVEMGGNGSGNWDKAQRSEIKHTGKVRGAEGHHQRNVADHPEQQADPDNIKFYKDRQKHLKEGHNGDWHNESDAELIDKNKMLEKTNSKRVFRNELKGLGIAVAIGLGIGVTIEFVTTLAQSGITPDSLKYAATESVKAGAESGILSAVGYGIGRTIGETAAKALTGTIENFGIQITENISTMVNMGTIGTLTIAVFSVYQFIKLKCRGYATREAVLQIGKQALFSLSLLTVSVAAQGIWGGAAGIIVSVSIGVIMISYSVKNTVHQRRFSEKIRVYTIENCYPQFAV